jgi:predicted NUDIX family phosphoesterase
MATCDRLQSQFRIIKVNTSDPAFTRKKTAEHVASIVLDLVTEQLEEEILCASKTEVVRLFGHRTSIGPRQAERVTELFLRGSEFVPRAKAEESRELVQALPIVVVRTKSGQVLQLRRREKATDNPLHDRLVIWAGGHVRKEDASNGNCLVQGLLRELQEELRLSLEPADLELIGAIYADFGGSTSKHVALVYQWKASTDDVTVVLSHAEFFERRGTSLSGRFVAPADLRTSLSQHPEAWSEQIALSLLAEDFGSKELSLL